MAAPFIGMFTVGKRFVTRPEPDGRHVAGSRFQRKALCIGMKYLYSIMIGPEGPMHDSC